MRVLILCSLTYYFFITENRMLSLVDKMAKQVFSQYNYHDTHIATYSGGDNTFLEYYSPNNPKKTFPFLLLTFTGIIVPTGYVDPKGACVTDVSPG